MSKERGIKLHNLVTEDNKITPLSEVELFVELLDDQSASSIIKKFKEPIIGFLNPNLDKKKQHIKKIFKRQTPKTRKGMNKNSFSTDPFIICVKSFEIEEVKNVDKKEAFKFISSLYDVADHVKFANVFLHCNEELKKKLPDLIEKLNEGKPLFQLEQNSLTYEEANNIFFAKVLYNGEDGMKKLYQEINAFIPENFKDKVIELVPRIKIMKFEEFQNQFFEIKDEAPDYIIYFIYGLTHPTENKDILLIIAANVLNKLTLYYYKKNKETKNLVENFEKNTEKINTKLLKIQEKNEEVNKFREESQMWKKKFEAEIEENKKNKIKVNRLEEKLINTQNEIKEIEKNIEIERKINEKKIKQINEEKQILNISLENVKIQFQNLGVESNNFSTPNFSVIYSSETILFESIFKEVKAVHISNWVNSKYKIITNYIDKIYVQRDGISTKKLQEIEKEAIKNNIKIETFLASSPKELLEKVAYFKYKEREVI